MIQQAKAKIFLADQRGINETEKFQSRHTFNFCNYFNEHKHGFSNIYLLNDDTLAGGGSLKMLVKEYSHIILVPVAGAINYKDSTGANNIVAAGQVQLFMAEKGTTIEIINPFTENPVNFLQIWIRAHKTAQQSGPQLTTTYEDVNENLNTLVQAVPTINEKIELPFILSLGKFSGRGETIYIPKNRQAGIFAFVVEGAFELEGRLLHARDGLAVWETGAIEMEALSNDAIIILIELLNFAAA